jgi:hypothetical protein
VGISLNAARGLVALLLIGSIVAAFTGDAHSERSTTYTTTYTTKYVTTEYRTTLQSYVLTFTTVLTTSLVSTTSFTVTSTSFYYVGPGPGQVRTTYLIQTSYETRTIPILVTRTVQETAYSSGVTFVRSFESVVTRTVTEELVPPPLPWSAYVVWVLALLATIGAMSLLAFLVSRRGAHSAGEGMRTRKVSG